MKQSIIIPNKVTSTLFDLPCILSIHKRDVEGMKPFYCILNPSCAVDRHDWQFASPGDTLIEEDNGKWRVEKQRQQ